jgi:hypothetical protein
MKHVAQTKPELLAILDDIRTSVERNDSFEGGIEYLMPGPGDPPEARFMVRGSYRVGNSQGQGGVVLVGEAEPA